MTTKPTESELAYYFSEVDEIVNRARLKARHNDVAVVLTVREGGSCRLCCYERVELLRIWEDIMVKSPRLYKLLAVAPTTPEEVPVFVLVDGDVLGLHFVLDKTGVVLN